MDAAASLMTPTVAAAAALACPAGSPLLLFFFNVIANVSRATEAERAQRVQLTTTIHPEYDYIVVGGGSAGCVLAARLSENKSNTVLLLERGGHETREATVPAYTVTNLRSAMSEDLLSQPDKQYCNATGCALNVPNVLGGGSTINGMVYARGSSVDYDEWARITGDSSWSYEKVLPYFKKSEDNLNPVISADTKYHGRGGPLKVSWQPFRHPVMQLFAAALGAAGVRSRLDMNAESQLGYSVAQTTTANGERWSTYRGYVKPVERRSNLRVETFATVRKVVLNGGAGGKLAADGVQYEDAAGRAHVVRARKEVVLAAGALHTPQILMLSGIGPADHLKALGIPLLADLPVGDGLMDHPDIVGVPYKCGPPLCATDMASRLADVRQYSEGRTGPLSELAMLHANAYIRSSLAKAGTGQQPDLQLFLQGKAYDDLVTCLPFDSWRFNLVLPVVSLMRPESAGWVRLNASDPRGQPLVKLNYFGDAAGHDLDVSVEGLKMALRLNETLTPLGLTLDTDSVRECTAEGSFGSDAFLRCVARTRTRTAWHWSGTCRMGRAGDTTAVLDSRLRVRGVERLRVADASAIPYIPSGNINAPTIMLAERAADIIRGRA